MALFFKDLSTDLIALFVICMGLAYFYAKYAFAHWERKGIKYLKPSFPLGNFTESFLQKTSAGELLQKLYNSTSEPFVGIFGVLRPMILVRDTELIRRIFIKDFQYFADRGVYFDEERDPLSAHLFAIEGEKWKNLRTKLSPVFTSGKLKTMFSTLLDCGKNLTNHLDKQSEKNSVIEVREIAARFTTDIIGSTAFGIEVNTMENPNVPFRKLGRKAFETSFKNGIRTFIAFICPPLQPILKLKSVDEDVEKFFIDLVRDTMEYREKNNISRKDLLQLLIQLRNSGSVEQDGNWDTKIVDDKNKTLTFNEVAAQAWVFYIAGFETSSSTMSYCLYELARNTEIQRKVQQEIDEVTAKYNGELTYDSIAEMKYLEMCIDETLRKHPVVPILNRICTHDYKVPGTSTVIEKGTPILIPCLALHRDEKYFPEPLKFIPERFSAENRKAFEEMPYMSFGDGPRNCIGLRMGKLQSKVGLYLMLRKFNYHIVDNEELKMSPKSFILQPISGINLRITKRAM